MADYVPIESQDDPRLATDFNPEAFISGEDTTTATQDQPQSLPTVTPKLSTFYFPATPEETKAAGLRYSMEGGTQGGGRFGDIDLRNHTLEQYLGGNSPFVAVAMKGEPTGQEFQTTILGHDVVAKNVDTGGGLRDGQVDFATSNPELARTGIQHGPFDPEAFTKRLDITKPSVPDIHAFLEPAPAEETTPETTTETGGIGKALGEGIGAAAKAIGAIARPQLNPSHVQINQPFQIPTAGQLPTPPLIQQQQAPQIQAPQSPPPDLSQIAPLIQQLLPQPSAYQPQPFQPQPSPQPMPTPIGTPQPVSPITGGLFDATVPTDFRQILQALRLPMSTNVDEQMQQSEQWGKAIRGELGQREQVAALVTTAMAIDPLSKLGGKPPIKSLASTASREIPGAFAGAELPPSGRQIGVSARPEPQLTQPLQFSVDMPTDTFGTEHTPVSSAIIDMGGVMSKSTAQRTGRYAGNAEQWDAAQPLAHPTHNKIYPSTSVAVLDKMGAPTGKFRSVGSGGEMPDIAAQTLHDAGLISDPSPDAMWNAVASESKSARSRLASQRSDAAAVSVGAKQQVAQAKAFNAAEQKAWKGGQPAIPVKDLKVGDKVKVGGEDFKVTDIDPDTFDVTLEDGTKFGVQSVKDGTVIYGQHEGTEAKPPPAATPPPASKPRATVPPSTPPPQPPRQPPPQRPSPPTPPAKPSYSSSLNPVADWGPFSKTYKIDKELGEMMDSLGAAPETGALMAETQSRNMLHELTSNQEADLGKLLLSDRLRNVNPDHPQIIFDSMARGIESTPAIKKALDYYRKEVEPELEEIGKRAGLQEGAAATQRGKYFTLSPERAADGTVPELAPRFGQTSRTTKYSLPAEGQAAKYSSYIRDVLRQSYTERIRKATARELFDAAHAKGVVEPTPQFVPDPENGPTAGKWVNTIKEGNLPEGMRHDLNLIAAGKSTMQPEGIQKVLQGYQRGATAVQLGANPLEIQNHMRRQLAILSTKPPVGKGVMARLEAVVPFFGPKIGTMKRAMSDMSTPARQQILKDITSAGGGSSRAFREKYGTQLPVLKNISEFTNKLLFGYPTGKGVMGFDLRMRVLLEEIRRNAEPNLANDKQRMRQFANQMGQYGTMASWPVRALRHINPYAATTLPMRWAELRTLVGGSGLRSSTVPEALMRRAETFVRGTGGTIAMLTIANKLLSGNWPWQNRPGHEFDLKTGVKDKSGNDIYVPNRFLSPEMFRALSTYSVPPLLAERGAPNRSALSETAAATLGPINAGLSLINSPGLGIAAAAIPQWALHAEKFPGQKSIDLMKVGQYTAKDQARGVPPLLKRAEGVAEQLHPALASILGYMQEPIQGLKPLGVLSVDKSGGGGGTSRHVSHSQGRGSGGRVSGRGRGGR